MDQFRPTISALKPPEWSAKESVTLVAPDGQANVIASGETLPDEFGTDQYAQVQGEVLKTEFPGYREIAFESKRIFGGRDGRMRRFEWQPPDGAPVIQIQLYYAEARRGYMATATTPTNHFADVELELMDILDGLTLEEVTGRAGLEPTAAESVPPLAAHVDPDA